MTPEEFWSLTPREVVEVVEAHGRRQEDALAASVTAAWHAAWFGMHSPLGPEDLHAAIDRVRGRERPLPSSEELLEKFDALTAAHNAGVTANG